MHNNQVFSCTWQEIQLKDSDIIRALFERAVSLSLPPKKMKVSAFNIFNFADFPFLFSPAILTGKFFCLNLQCLFKKYLEYEKSQGDEERIEYVKKKAMEYVESSLG